MIASSKTLKLFAILVAAVAHGALGLVLMAEQPVQIEGASGAAEVRLGNSFRDLVSNDVQAVEAEDVLTDAAPTDVLAPEPAPEAVAEAKPEETLRPAPVNPLRVAAVNVSEPVPVTPQVIAALPATKTAPAPKPEAETLRAQEPRPEIRPKPRPKTPKPPKKTVKKTTPKPKAAKKAPAPMTATKQQSRATQERVGSESGKNTAKAVSKGAGGASKQAGNAAISNYPGKVMRKLSRARKLRIRAGGDAVVGFRIAPSGALSSLSILRSSGSAELDQAALKQIRRAAPFPKPPQGANTSFRITVEGA